jgi:glycosyltransferase involved in cell wall biosynthesis
VSPIKIKMKILSVNNTADLYGASRCMERLVGRFTQDGHEVHAVLPERGRLADLLEACGVRVHTHRCLAILDRAQLRSFSGCLRFLFLFPISVLWLVALTLRLRIDLVHSNTVVMPTPSIAAFITGRAHIWHVRELLGEFGWLWKPYQRYIHLLSSAVIAISRCTREQFDQGLLGKVHVIYDGLDETAAIADPEYIKAFREPFPDGAKLIGVVGRIKWHRKGQEVLVRAAALIRHRHPEAHYVLVGSAAPGNEDHVRRLRELISASDLDDAVTLTGDCHDPASVFAALDIAVVPSVQPEPFGRVVIEAMAAGTAVVGSHCGGIAEQIVDGVSGILFAPGSHTALAGALDLLLNDPEFRARLAGAGRQRAHEDFALESTYRATAALFSKCTASQDYVAIQDSAL